MAIELLTISEWIGERNETNDVENPDWKTIEEAICALDNKKFDDVYLTPDKNNIETYMCVGGGNGRYLVTGSIGNESFPTLVNPQNSLADDEEKLVVGGQEGIYPNKWIVELDFALDAVRAFFETGDFSDTLIWENA